MVSFKKISFKYNKKCIFYATAIFTFTLLFILPYYFHSGLKEMIASSIAYLIRIIADSVSNILKEMDCGIDKLVFNCSDGINSSTVLNDLNLSLLKSSSTALTEELYKLYYLFEYIAISILGSIGLWCTFDFIKCANDSRHRAILKDRLIKLVFSIVLLSSIPTIFDILVVINQTFVDIFRMFIIDSNINVDNNGFLMDIFKQICDKDTSNIIYAAIYLISGFLNFWLVFYYMIRDLTISFLFILAPVIVILLPYRTDLMIKWLKELCSNLFSQSIQAFILTVVIKLATSISDSNASMYDNIFALVAFAMFIPLTATVKKMLGLEGEVGAAKSNAGLGAAIGAIGLAGVVGGNISKSFGRAKSGISDLKNIGAEQKLLKKSEFNNEGANPISNGIPQMNDITTNNGIKLVSNKNGLNGNLGGRGQSIDPNNRSAANRNHNVDTNIDSGNIYTATDRARQLQGMKVNAKKEVAKSLGSGLLGALGGGIMATGMSAYGSPMMAVMGAKGGSALGGKLGEIGGNGLVNLGSDVNEKIQDSVFGEGIRYDNSQRPALKDLFDGVESFTPSNMSKNLDIIKGNFNENRDIINSNKATLPFAQQTVTGLDANKMKPSDYKQETDAILKRNRYERRGLFDQANREYAKSTYNRNRTNLNGPTNPELNSGPNFEKLNGANDNPKLDSPISPSMQKITDNDKSYINVLNKSLEDHKNDYIENSGFNTNDMKYTDLLQQLMNHNLRESLDSMFGNDALYVNDLNDSMNYNMKDHIQSQIESGDLQDYSISDFPENDYNISNKTIQNENNSLNAVKPQNLNYSNPDNVQAQYRTISNKLGSIQKDTSLNTNKVGTAYQNSNVSGGIEDISLSTPPNMSKGDSTFMNNSVPHIQNVADSIDEVQFNTPSNIPQGDSTFMNSSIPHIQNVADGMDEIQFNTPSNISQGDSTFMNGSTPHIQNIKKGTSNYVNTITPKHMNSIGTAIQTNNPISNKYSNESYLHPRIKYNPITRSTNSILPQNYSTSHKERIMNTRNSRETHIREFINNEEYLQALKTARNTIDPLHISGTNSQLA